MRFLTVLLPFITLALHVAATDLEAQQSSPAQRPCAACIQKAKRIAARGKKSAEELSTWVYDNYEQYYAEANTAILSCFFVGVTVVAFYEGAQHGLFSVRGESSPPNCQSLDCSRICAPVKKIQNCKERYREDNLSASARTGLIIGGSA
ncbi:hypothetical protein DFJ43DRAFT_757599 [Lentinula guzmanii]|uniref:Uncharacterized protein n=1 Tax=Lentinula guzmanii TaxID=2804957 RepID=A0AA38JH38_9AGAR|nr:hypothetical protein DFJ43DRAFT_757599 [Lentinula guzmanii]